MKSIYVLTAILLLGATACGSGKNRKANEKAEEISQQTGPETIDRDVYVWSAMDSSYVRLFDRSISFLSVNEPDMEHVVYAIFNADSSQVELFIPGMNDPQRTVLDRRTTINGFTWNIEDDDTYNLRQVNGQWIIEQRGRTVYFNSVKLEPILVRFEASAGPDYERHFVDVAFDPEAHKATLKLIGDTYELTQYVTESGYGFRNADVDFRGKGHGAKLDFVDDKIQDLVLTEIKE